MSSVSLIKGVRKHTLDTHKWLLDSELAGLSITSLIMGSALPCRKAFIFIKHLQKSSLNGHIIGPTVVGAGQPTGPRD